MYAVQTPNQYIYIVLVGLQLNFSFNKEVNIGFVTRKNRDKNGHLLGFVRHTYYFTNICTSFRNTIINQSLFIVYIFKYRTILHLIYVLEMQGYCFYSNNNRGTARKREHQQQEQQSVSAYSSMSLPGVCNGLFRTLYVYPCAVVHSFALPGVPVFSHVFSMHPNWPLLDIIFLRYGLESAFVVDFPTPCVFNFTASN